MTSAAIPFKPAQATGLEVLAGASPMAANVVLEPSGALRRRPGITTFSGVPSSVIDANGIAALHVSEVTGAVYAVGAVGPERPIYRLSSGGSVKLGGGAPPTGVRGLSRPVFAETEAILAIAGGAEVQKVELAPGFLSARLGGSPPQASHVVANASRLLVNNLLDFTSQVYFSNPAGGKTDYSALENWTIGVGSSAGFFTAEARPDPIVALGENTGEVFVFGGSTLQVFQADAVGFAPVGTVEVGCGAAASVVKVDGAFFWLDDLNRFVRSEGRSFDVISDPIARTLDAIEAVSDCYGFRVSLGFLEAIVWTFPTDGRTFVFQKGVGWSQWTGWSAAQANWAPFTGTAVANSGTRRAAVIGTSDGYVGQLSFDSGTDLGRPINVSVTTGYINRETDKRKHCESVSLSLRRGTTPMSRGPLGHLCFRDGPNEPLARIPIDFGSSGDTEIVLTFYALGVYRRRQWTFEFSDSADLSLVSATENFVVLDV